MCINVIARDKVLYEGHAVAAVAASTRDQAQAAAAAVKVEYDVLPAVLTIDQALAPDAPRAARPHDDRRGQPARGGALQHQQHHPVLGRRPTSTPGSLRPTW